MNKKMIVASALMVLSLLSACGQTDRASQENQNHSAHTNEQTEEHSDSHGGHGDEPTLQQEELEAFFTFASGTAKAQEATELTIAISDTDGNPVHEFERSHEKLLHLIIVDHDLSYFSHIHPEFQGDGTFTIDTTFPRGGEYKAFADFVPSGGSNTTLSEWVKVDGEEGKHAPITADSELVKVADGKEVSLSLSSMNANEEITLTFDIRDAITKEGIDSLEPYLGAVGHVVILSADAEQYIHVHPLDEEAAGPKAQFAATFPKRGIYKIWGQFQHNGQVFTVPYVVDIL